jgi:hypothetical protein
MTENYTNDFPKDRKDCPKMFQKDCYEKCLSYMISRQHFPAISSKKFRFTQYLQLSEDASQKYVFSNLHLQNRFDA